MREIDMTPFEEYFTKLERLYFERKARMNIVAYMADRQFSDDQYNRVFNDYVISLKTYENYISIFEQNVVIPACNNELVHWKADFER